MGDQKSKSDQNPKSDQKSDQPQPKTLKEFNMCLDSYIADVDSNPAHTTLIFTLKEEPGALAETLKVFKVRKNNPINNFGD